MKHESGLTLNQLAERNANLVTEIEKCRELSSCPAGVDLQDWVKQLAAENVERKALIPENWQMHDVLHQLIVARPGGVYFNKWEKLIVGVLNETPATDRIVAGIKADAIDEAAVELDRVDTVASTRVIGFKLREFSQQLREGAK
ncbi:hypothetical protein [Klebsiella pneumoniae]|uniref:hypothetical protein n=1 Tax=Klebsiella pneumoniae TaxID=573 RepID=UPI000CEBCF55|nr:hypothetical protein [Klebsiella pneumoniae]QBP07692.1 hypothetical protein [Klebsiella phage ST846-OXA48phi9.2]EKW0028022.1 hypothetical protein [Klebsiella pneumoniae]MBS2890411.1 hypothetical protein [Klebsiella pneumoniae]MCE0097590.1 hypothetical protein [Klebsiella pneumoniae]QPB96869.1 hypothetical protein IFY67_03116 [Klebsiella pneumoniae]